MASNGFNKRQRTSSIDTHTSTVFAPNPPPNVSLDFLQPLSQEQKDALLLAAIQAHPDVYAQADEKRRAILNRVINFDSSSKMAWSVMNPRGSIKSSVAYEMAFEVQSEVERIIENIRNHVSTDSAPGTKLSAAVTLRKIAKSMALCDEPEFEKKLLDPDWLSARKPEGTRRKEWSVYGCAAGYMREMVQMLKGTDAWTKLIEEEDFDSKTTELISLNEDIELDRVLLILRGQPDQDLARGPGV